MNVRLPEQLLLRFNAAAPQGKRNKLVAVALERYLEEHVSPVTETRESRIAAADQIASEIEAFEAMREHAAAILQIAAKVLATRKGPQAAPPRPQRRKRTRTA